MYWEYRVVRHHQEEYTWLSVHEIYYYSDGRIMGWIKQPTDLFGESLDELRNCIEDIESSLSKPIMQVEDLPQ